MQSGYKTLTPIQLSNIFFAAREAKLSRKDIQVYFGCFAIVAIREAATRYQKRRHKKPKSLSRYRLHELSRLTGLSEPVVKRALFRLNKMGLLTYGETEIRPATEPLTGSNAMLENLSCGRSPMRPIPVPRAVLRFLAQNKKLSVSKTMVSYIVRGLSISAKGGEIKCKGTAKVPWIAKTIEISERAVHYGRGELIRMGWIERDKGSFQRKLNRDGAYFVINVDWALVKREKPMLDFAPPHPKKCTVFAPPNKDKKTSIEDKNQKTQCAQTAGVFKKEEDADPPNLFQIEVGDLYRFSRIERLYFEAVKKRWFAPSESMALNFLAAAVKAREVGEDPPRLFVSLVKRKLWDHINQAQEDQAHAALVKFREKDPGRFRCESEVKRRAA